MATITKVLTTSGKSVSVSGGVLRGMVGFVDDKGNDAGRSTVTVKDGKVMETGLAVSEKLAAAIATIDSEFSALVDALIKAGSLDPMSRGRHPVPAPPRG